jgi:hypothetical protein
METFFVTKVSCRFFLISQAFSLYKHLLAAGISSLTMRKPLLTGAPQVAQSNSPAFPVMINFDA